MLRLGITFTLLLATTSWSLSQLQAFHKESALEAAIAAEQEVLYLPDGTAINVLSFGYQNLLSNIFWFQTISYFGKHYKSDRNYKWLAHMCDLVTDLNTKAEHVYEFCSTMLAWEVERADLAIDLLTKAINSNPDYWRYYYLRGFNYFYFLQYSDLAQQDFVASSKKPDAPPFVARLAAQKMTTSDPNEAVMFLEDMISATSDLDHKKILESKLNTIKLKMESANNE